MAERILATQDLDINEVPGEGRAQVLKTLLQEKKRKYENCVPIPEAVTSSQDVRLPIPEAEISTQCGPTRRRHITKEELTKVRLGIPLEADKIYVGRTVGRGGKRSMWANPFRIGVDGSRAGVLKLYRP